MVILDRLLDATLAGYTAPGLALRRRSPDWPADPPGGALTGRRVVVTGASSGIGEQVARQSASLGADVDLVVRNLAKGWPIADRIDAECGRSATRLWRADMADPAQARSCGQALAAYGPVHAIVHNAGVLPDRPTSSPDGHELSMAVHVLGPVRLTDEMAPALSADARVVFVSSGGMFTQALPAEDPDSERATFSGSTAYARSKRTQVDLLPKFQQRWPAAAVYAMHPGWVDTPGLATSLPGFRRLTRRVLRDAAQGADTIDWLIATEPRPPGATLWHDRRTRAPHRLARTRSTPQQVQAMWEWVCDAVAH
ncbi:SDR family NAD(P)-dependent oxidoreductase [Calidifontibacter terrae]